MYVRDGATTLADSVRVLGGILSRPVVLFYFVVKMSLICMKINLYVKSIFILTVSRDDSC